MKKHTQCIHSGTYNDPGTKGITDALLSLSVGIEDTDDIIADIDQAL
jgi:cystathionine beta-lyase/cystathionine gamma-synthase